MTDDPAPKLASVNTVHFYDPMLDAEAVRISGFSDRGGEYWIRMPLEPAGKKRRLQREQALMAISEAIESGLEPGQVIVD